jgi:hypothetical protein
LSGENLQHFLREAIVHRFARNSLKFGYATRRMSNDIHNFRPIVDGSYSPSTTRKAHYAPDTKSVDERDRPKGAALIDDPPFFIGLEIGIEIAA